MQAPDMLEFVKSLTLLTGERMERLEEKAIEIFEEFEQSKQLAYAVRTGMIDEPWILSIKYLILVSSTGRSRSILRSRYKGHEEASIFAKMEYSEDPEQIRKWAPLLIEGGKISHGCYLYGGGNGCEFWGSLA